MRAFIFPGQGSQKIGMGADLASASAAAREVFGEVDEALSQKLSALMREGPEADLTLTENAQPAIMANAMATLRVLERDFGVQLTEHGACVAGHSLGEYTALCAVGAFSLSDTARLLKLRGLAMQSAVPVGEGTMAALLGADIDQAKALAEAAAPVSAPFHCALMQPAAERMAEALAQTPPAAFTLPLYANVTAARVTDPEVERGLLIEQVTGRVRWRESVLAMRADGVESFVELGGKVLGPMVGRIDREAQVASLVTMQDIEAFAKELV